MDEQYFKDKISGYFDGDLKPEEMQMMAEWLEHSPEGQKALAELGRLDEFVRQHSDLSGSDDFWEAQAKKIEARLGFENTLKQKVTDIRPARSSGLGWKMIAAAASVALLVYVGVNRDDIFNPDDLGIGPSPDTTGIETAIPGKQIQPPSETANEHPAGREEDQAVTGESKKVEEPLMKEAEFRTESASPTPPAPAPVADQAPRRTSPSTSAEMPAIASPETADRDKSEDGADLKSLSESAIAKSETVKPPTAGEDLPAMAGRAAADEATSTISTDSSLAVWRQTYARAESTLMAPDTDTAQKPKPGIQIPGLTNSLTRKSAPASAAQTPEQRAALEAELLEACFQIAENTPDSAEYVRMRERLLKVANDSKSANQQLARTYLDRLPARK